MFKISFLALVLISGLAATSLAFAVLSTPQGPCLCCGSTCICEVCECDLNGCDCDAGGDCDCDAACCLTCCAE